MAQQTRSNFFFLTSVTGHLGIYCVVMGSSESKVAVASTPKHDPSHRIKHDRLSQLVDPRSPSVAIDRTPIQVTLTEKGQHLKMVYLLLTHAFEFN